MDPPIVNNASISALNPPCSSYALSELWPFPIPMPLMSMPPTFSSTPDAAVSVDESTITHQSAPATAAPNSKRKPINSHPHSSSTTANHFSNDANAKRIKASGGVREENDDDLKAEGETSSQTGSKPAADPPNDYIHVRARRGQATDSHSLAERARREKISERMKILQDLVPGCNKVIGKAIVLDEIINYIQSLQRQVEFLSMKLEAVNSRMNPTIEGFPSKDLTSPSFDATAMIYGQQAPRGYAQVAQLEWLHMQVSSSFERAT